MYLFDVLEAKSPHNLVMLHARTVGIGRQVSAGCTGTGEGAGTNTIEEKETKVVWKFLWAPNTVYAIDRSLPLTIGGLWLACRRLADAVCGAGIVSKLDQTAPLRSV